MFATILINDIARIPDKTDTFYGDWLGVIYFVDPWRLGSGYDISDGLNYGYWGWGRRMYGIGPLGLMGNLFCGSYFVVGINLFWLVGRKLGRILFGWCYMIGIKA